MLNSVNLENHQHRKKIVSISKTKSTRRALDKLECTLNSNAETGINFTSSVTSTCFNGFVGNSPSNKGLLYRRSYSIISAIGICLPQAMSKSFCNCASSFNSSQLLCFMTSFSDCIEAEKRGSFASLMVSEIFFHFVT